MKKKYFILTAMAGIILTGCTNDELAGGNDFTSEAGSGAITFSAGSSAITRADLLYGSSAASRLSNRFVVYGTKHVNAEDKTADNDAVVFNNFQVKWTASTTSTASSTSDWDYVGLQSYDATPTSQGIKYWDYNAAQGHTFYAFSSTDISYPKNATSDKVQVSKVKSDATSLYNKGYALTLKTGANLRNLYFSDRVPVAKTDYEKPVSFTFRNIGTLLRIGFYETIPGYRVKIDRFYIDADATAAVTSFAAMNNSTTSGFNAALQNVKRSVDQTLNVTYYDDADATIENRPKLTQPTAGYDYSLKLGSAAGIIDKYLGTTSAETNVTWVDGSASGDYTPVCPFEGNTNPLLIKLDFTMYAEDGSPDVIHVRGARAVVPAELVKWKSNFAYTYIFKIGSKTNGTTGEVDANGDPTDPEGLTPITFDATVVDVTEEMQQTITSVSSNSITTYAEGKITNEYKKAQTIYSVISNTASGAVITPSAIGTSDGEAQVYKLSKAATEAEVLAQLTGAPMGITMTAETASLETTVPLADETTASLSNVKFTPSTAATYYAYVYTTTEYVAPTYTSQASGTYDSSKTYYMQSGSGAYYAVSVTTAEAFNDNKASLYTIEAGDEGTAGVYDVKVIKVQ